MSLINVSRKRRWPASVEPAESAWPKKTAEKESSEWFLALKQKKVFQDLILKVLVKRPSQYYMTYFIMKFGKTKWVINTQESVKETTS